MDIKQTIKNIPGNVYWINSDNIYVWCSQCQAEAFGLKDPLEVIGKSNKDLPLFKKYPAIADTINKNNQLVLNEGSTKIFEETIIINDNEFVFLSHKMPLLEEGKIVGLLGMSSEITKIKAQQKREQLENEQLRLTLESIIANLPGHVYWKNVDGVYLGCNDLQAQSLGLNSGKELIGKTDFELPWKAGVAKEYRENDLQVMQTKEIKIIEETSQVKGRKIIVLSHKVPLIDNNNNVFGIVGISLDITVLKEVEQKLLVSKEKAEAADKAKTEFLRNMRHDFRTPFSGILGMASILQEQEEDHHKKELLGDIANSAQELLEQLNEIADFISSEEGEIPILDMQFDLHKVVNAIKRLLLPPAKNKNLKLSLTIERNIPQYVIGDKTRTYRILINLLTNSIKFTKDGKVSLSIAVAKIEEQRIIIKFIVKDTGIGFSAKEKDIIFTKFSRLTPSYTGIYTGKGLGLRIVKQFLDEVGGEIHVDSQIDNGSTFVVLIPYKLPLLECNEKELINNNSSL